MSKTMPVVFIGHGAPMNAVRSNAFTESLAILGMRLPKPAAVLVISAHWETKGTKILHHAAPSKINDFFGDHPDLHALQYAPPGTLEFAQRTCELIPGAELSSEWGIDHGSWSMLIHLFPKADVPVYQLSLDVNLSSMEHYLLAGNLRALRDMGILIVGSGNICHNVRQISSNPDAAPHAWNVAFDQQVAAALQEDDHVSIVNWQNAFAEHAASAVPTPEHFLPLIYALGACKKSDDMSVVFEGYEHASMSLRSMMWQAVA